MGTPNRPIQSQSCRSLAHWWMACLRVWHQPLIQLISLVQERMLPTKDDHVPVGQWKTSDFPGHKAARSFFWRSLCNHKILEHLRTMFFHVAKWKREVLAMNAPSLRHISLGPSLVPSFLHVEGKCLKCNVGIAIVNHQFLMVYTTHLW